MSSARQPSTTHFPASPEGLAAIAQIRRMLAPRPRDETRSVADRREEATTASAASAARFAVLSDTVGGVEVERHAAVSSAGRGLMLFAHGGAYVSGSAATHRAPAAHVAAEVGSPLLSVNYRLAPEHPFPAGRDDIVAVYAALIAAGKGPIALVGSSAGGGVMLQAALAIRDAGLPGPVAIAVTSPWVDFACQGASHRTWGEADLMLSTPGLLLDAARYLGGLAPDLPRVSPLHADLQGLPPVFIQVGEHEILADDATRLARALAAANVPVELEVWSGMTHAWQAFRGMVPEADLAVARMGAFLKIALART